ncbi:type II/IV secretion system ATPase subunit, partial [Candidatus Micrarchaeota archaeon]|nr:type II/IV secretion system ATPase subunit [Candidatus Micrarchaeota archaeon]
MPCGEFVVKTEGEKRRLIFNCKGCPYGSNIAEYPQCMKNVIERLQEVDADEIVLSEYYERIYGEEQTRILKSVAEAVSRLEAEAVWSPSHLGTGVDNRAMAQRHQKIMLILDNLKTDPFKAYLLLLQELKNETAKASTLTGEAAEDEKVYLQTLGTMRNVVEGAEIITKMKQFLAQMGSLPTDRGLYHSIFQSAIKPSFIGSRIFFGKAEQLQLLDQYEVLGSQIHIYQHPDRIECLYFVNPPEYTLPPEKYFLLEKTKEVVSAHRPSSVGFMDIVQARKYFHKIYVATISDLATRNRISLSVEEKEDLATIVSRYTIGYGILEILLSDRSITDVYIDSPLGDKPIYLVHQKYGQCQTNIIFSDEEARALVSRFRALSGRPFDEAHPILDFDLQDLQTRIAVIGRPMASDGTAFALRLHKETPWTIPQFLDKKMFNQLAAGLFSFLVDAQASMLIVGSRGAGKTSFLQAMMLEIPQNMRIIVQED